MAEDSTTPPLWKSQRGMVLVIAMVLFFFLMIVGAVYGGINDTALTVMGGLIGAGGAYYFKEKGEEAKIAMQR